MGSLWQAFGLPPVLIDWWPQGSSLASPLGSLELHRGWCCGVEFAFWAKFPLDCPEHSSDPFGVSIFSPFSSSRPLSAVGMKTETQKPCSAKFGHGSRAPLGLPLPNPACPIALGGATASRSGDNAGQCLGVESPSFPPPPCYPPAQGTCGWCLLFLPIWSVLGGKIRGRKHAHCWAPTFSFRGCGGYRELGLGSGDPGVLGAGFPLPTGPQGGSSQ